MPLGLPNPLEILRTGLAMPGAVLSDPRATMQQLGEAAPDVLGRPLSAPLWILNQFAKRDAAGRANVAANTLQMPMASPVAPLAGAVLNYGAGWAGIRPQGTGPESPFVDYLHQQGWNQSGSEALLGALPDNLRAATDALTMAGPSIPGLPNLGDARRAADFATSPQGADVATSIGSGMALDASAVALAKATARIRALAREMTLRTPVGRSVAAQVAPFGGVPAEIVPQRAGSYDPYLAGPRPENPREALQRGVASMAAERERLAGRSEALATEGERTLTQGMQAPGPMQEAKNAVRGRFGKPPVAYGESRGTAAPVNPREYADPRYAHPRETPLTPTERGKQLQLYMERAGQYPGEGLDRLELAPGDLAEAKAMWARGEDPAPFVAGLPYIGHRAEDVSAFLRRSMHGDNWRMGLQAMERDRILTPRERSFLEQSSQTLQESMPAEKRMVGLKPEELGHNLDAAAQDALSKINRVRALARELPSEARALPGAIAPGARNVQTARGALANAYEEAVAAVREYERIGSARARGSYTVLGRVRPVLEGGAVHPADLNALQQAERLIGTRSRDVVRFTPREQVPAAAKARRSSPDAGYASDTSLESGRAVPATTTTTGARQAIRQETKIREPIAPITEGIRTVGRQHAAKVSQQRFVNWVADAFGETENVSPLTHVPLSRLPGSTEGLAEDQAAKLAATHVRKDVYDGVARVFQVLDHSTKPGVRAMIDRGLRRSLQAEKRHLTASIRFITRNRVAEWVYMMLDGTKPWMNVEHVRKILDPAFEHTPIPRDLWRPGMPETYGELRQMGERVGVGFDANTLGSEVGVPAWGRVLPELADEPTILGKARVAARKATSPVRDTFKAHASANVSGENVNRWNLWFDKYVRQQMDPMDARMSAGRTLFDYMPEFYTPLENEARKWVTWYAWMRNNAMFAARIAFTKPGTLSAIGNVPRQWNLKEGYSPEEMQYISRAYLTRYGLVLPDAPTQPPGTKRVMDLSPLSITDPAEYFTAPDDGKEGWQAWGEHLFLGAFNALRPDIPAAVGLAFGVDPQSGRNVAGDSKRPEAVGQMPTWVVWLPPDVRAKLQIQVMSDGTPVGPKRIAPLLRLAGGAPGQLAGAGAENPRLQSQFVSWLTGISIDPEAPEAENRAMPGILEIQEAKGLKTKWLREMYQTRKFEDRASARRAAQADTTQGGMRP